MSKRTFRYCLMLLLINFVIFSNSTMSLAKDDKLIYVSSQYVSQPDELVIYEGDITYAKDTTQIDAQDIIGVKLPSSAILKTLVIYDGGKRVKHFNYSEAVNFSQSSSAIFGYRCNETKAFPSSSLAAHSPGASGFLLSKNVVSWKTHIKGSRQVVLEYSLNGISWSPIYNMNILSNKEITFLYKAMIANRIMPLKDVKIRLASGMIEKSQIHQSHYYDSNLPPEVAALYDIPIKTRPNQTPSPQISANYIYELGRQNLDKGTTFIELFDKELECRKEFIWAVYFGQRVDVNYQIKNSTKQAFAQGLVDVYQDGLYLGSDQIQNTAPGWVANVTFCKISDIRVNKTLNVTYIKERDHKRYHHEAELKIENLSDKEIKMKIFDIKCRNCVEAEYSIKPLRLDGSSILWEVSIPAGETKSILYDFYSDSSNRNPYQAY